MNMPPRLLTGYTSSARKVGRARDTFLFEQVNRLLQQLDDASYAVQTLFSPCRWRPRTRTRGMGTHTFRGKKQGLCDSEAWRLWRPLGVPICALHMGLKLYTFADLFQQVNAAKLNSESLMGTFVVQVKSEPKPSQ